MRRFDERPEFDHLLHWVRGVPEATEAYRAAGVPAHTNEALDGFQNGGWRLDTRYIETLTITDPDALRASRYAEGLRLLRPAVEALEGPAGAFTFAVNVTDARATAERLRAQGHEVAEFEVEMAEHGVSFVEIFVLDGPPWQPFFITYDPPREELLAGVDPAAFERGPHDLTGLVVTDPQPREAARALARLLGLRAENAEVLLPGAHIRFERGERRAITAVTLSDGSGVAGPDTEVEGLVLRFTG
ncbi:VOC family protein [Streptomyces sp. XM4193]|uniref:VOC family protein n=1 Tax=Streptomyces sp. XM4193 TaxID=2929782 RepID=UPI001FF8983D|nr:VOC family protein [Streptomyces sp. XM4193]MCK1794747.1 VOC family protein [Streptomyces sp. XM4193]